MRIIFFMLFPFICLSQHLQANKYIPEVEVIDTLVTHRTLRFAGGNMAEDENGYWYYTSSEYKTDSTWQVRKRIYRTYINLMVNGEIIRKKIDEKIETIQ